MSFLEVKNQIDNLNAHCEDQMKKKNTFYAPEIKKYKNKRLTIMEETNTTKDNIIAV